MRNPWNLLTLRGKAFGFLGLGVLVAAMLIGQRDLLWLGLLLVALPLVALLFIGRSRLRLSCSREMVPSQVPIGDSVRGHLTVAKAGRVPNGILLFTDHVPPALGSGPRFMVNDTRPEWSHEVEYTLVTRSRGRFRTGPLLVRSTDPFGLVTYDRQFSATSEVMVTPRIHPLGALSASGGGGNTGDSRPQRVGTIGSDDVLVREYRHGDDVRRVHWRSTARRGELMVRREEQAFDPSATILLDSRAMAHAGEAPDSSFEWAVSAAASVALHFLEVGFEVDLYHADGAAGRASSPDGHQMADREVLLHALTDIGASRERSMTLGLEAELVSQAGHLLVAVCGRLTSADAELLVRARRNRAQAMAIVVNPDSWLSRGARPGPEAADEHRAAIEVLRRHQWRVVEAQRDSSLADCWRDLNQMGALV